MTGAGAPVDDGRSETEPVAAKIRPQLVEEEQKVSEGVVVTNESRTLHLLRKEPFLPKLKWIFAKQRCEHLCKKEHPVISVKRRQKEKE